MSFSIVGRSDKEEVINERTEFISLVEYANEKRNSGLFNDVEICSGGESFPANRMVLSCFSPFFEKMFTVKMKEKHENSVSIDYIEASALQNVIDFIYIGTICINTDNVCTLLAVADYLQIEDVKKFCFDFLKSAITPDNCFLILKIAKQYESNFLIEAVQQVINKKFDEVACSEDFRNFSKVKLMTFLQAQDPTKVQEKSVYKAVVGWTKHDQENRAKYFYETLKTVKLHNLPSYFLQDTVNENLITESLSCTSLLLHGFSKHVKERLTDTKILSLGGKYSPLEVSEIFSCLDEPPQTYPDLPEDSIYGCSEKVGDSLYFIGGKENEQRNSRTTVWQLDLKADEQEWKLQNSLKLRRDIMLSTVFKGTIIVAGGDSPMEFFFLNDWNKVDESIVQVSASSLISGGDRLYMIVKRVSNTANNTAVHVGGSFSIGRRTQCSTSSFGFGSLSNPPTTGLFQVGNASQPSLPTPRPELQTTHLLVFDGVKKKWNIVRRVKTARSDMAAVFLNGFIYVIGGKNEKSSPLKTVERLDVVSKQRHYVSEMKFERGSCAACVMQGKIYVVGGVDAEGKVVREIECYDPAIDEWSVVGVTEDELVGHALVVV